LLKALLSSRSGDDCCVIRPLVRGLWINPEVNHSFRSPGIVAEAAKRTGDVASLRNETAFPK
jgi:hypothetical protein